MTSKVITNDTNENESQNAHISFSLLTQFLLHKCMNTTFSVSLLGILKLLVLCSIILILIFKFYYVFLVFILLFIIFLSLLLFKIKSAIF